MVVVRTLINLLRSAYHYLLDLRAVAAVFPYETLALDNLVTLRRLTRSLSQFALGYIRWIFGHF